MKRAFFIAASACIFLSIIHECSSYPSGAPLRACQDMIPLHSATTTSGTPPFTINISSNVYKTGSEIKGKIYSPNGVIFRGFLIQARKADNSSTTLLGEFIASGNDAHTNCGGKNKQGLTHSTNSNKTEIDFTWQAPADSQGDIRFKLTVVESYDVSRFWLGIYSDVVKDCALHPSAECDEITTEVPTTKSKETSGTIPAETSSGTGPAETSSGTSPAETSSPAVMTTAPPGKKVKNDPECGKTKGCFPDCSDGCDYLVTWQTDANTNGGDEAVQFDFQMMVENTDNRWTAIGLSPTGKMDETNVMACMSEGTGVSVESSHNEAYTNVMYSEKTMGLSDMKGAAEDGKISCSFTRAKVMNVSDYINSNDKVYLLVGTGPISNGIKLPHEQIPVRSSDKVDLMSTKISKESDSATPLVKLHGSLMVLAWVLLSSIGVIVARHFKTMMPGQMMCNVKYWFVIHRTLMFIVLLFVIVAFVAIFYEVGGFSKVAASPGKEYTKAHPYLGIIATAFTLLNPIMAFFRPSLTHKNRPIFNWAHFSVGTLAHLVAVVTIYFGISLSKAKVNSYAIHVMISYSAIFVIVQFILEVHRRINDNAIPYGKLNTSSGKLAAMSNEMRTYGSPSTDVSRGSKMCTLDTDEPSKLRSAVLLLHVILMVVAATLLILMICAPSKFPTA